MLFKFVVERNIRLTHNFQTKRDQKIARSFDVFDEKIILAFVFYYITFRLNNKIKEKKKMK